MATLMLGVVLARPACAETPTPSNAYATANPAVTNAPQDQQRRFDIPALPLADALERYGAMSGLPVFFDSALVAGRKSAPVRGAFTPDAALRMLLEGSGLTADYTAAGHTDAFILKQGAVPPIAAAHAPDSRTAYRAYDGLVQQRIWQAFCDDARTRPGDYRTAVRFGLDGAGHIISARLLHSTGDAGRDAAIVAVLDQVRVNTPPPPDMAQPLTMVILPRGDTPGLECRANP